MLNRGSYVLRSALVLSCAGLLLVVRGISIVSAEPSAEILQRVRAATVQILAVPNADPDRSELASGVIVSPDGFILTSYDLIRRLGRAEVDPAVPEGGIKFSIHFDDGRDDQSASYVLASSDTNLLLLSLPPFVDVSQNFLEVADARSIVDEEAGDLSFVFWRPDGGGLDGAGSLSIERRSVFGNPDFWELDNDQSDEVRGGPVFTDDGTMVGLLTGSVGEIDGSVMMPVHTSNYILAPVRLARLESALERVQSSLDGLSILGTWNMQPISAERHIYRFDFLRFLEDGRYPPRVAVQVRGRLPDGSPKEGARVELSTPVEQGLVTSFEVNLATAIADLLYWQPTVVRIEAVIASPSGSGPREWESFPLPWSGGGG